MFQLSEIYLLQSKVDEALALLEKMSVDGPEAGAAAMRVTEIYVEVGRIGEAQRRIDEYLKLNRGDLEAYYLDARLLLAQGDVAGGMRVLRHVLFQWPSFVRARHQLALAYWRRNEIESAAAELNRCLAYQPDFIAARQALAELQLQVGHYDLAREEATRVLAILPQSFDMRILLCDAAAGRGDREGSRAIAQRLTTEFPDRYEGHYRLGRALASLGRHPEARAELEKALAQSPTSVQVLAELVQSMKAAGGSDADCIQWVKAHADAHPDLALVKFLRGQLTIAGGDVDGGTAILEGAVGEHPDLTPAHYILGGVYAHLGKLTEARRHLDQLISRSPHVVAAYVILGHIEETEGYTAEAVKRYKQALDRSPNLAPAANNLAWHYAERESRLDLSLELARRARAAQPDDPHIADTLGWILYRRGLYGAAIEHLKESAAKLPENPEMRYHLGMAYLRNGDTEKARAELGTALKLGALPSRVAATLADPVTFAESGTHAPPAPLATAVTFDPSGRTITVTLSKAAAGREHSASDTLTAVFPVSGDSLTSEGDEGERPFEGYHEGTNCDEIGGWVWNPQDPDAAIDVSIYGDDNLLVTVTADQRRPDLLAAAKGNGRHAFNVPLPPALRDGRPHRVRVKVAGSSFDLRYTPQLVNCAGSDGEGGLR
jgi:tetratricopeptide (TPR) repeat protein